MLLLRYDGHTERERHVPLGPLYVTRALEDAGFSVDFRDYQTCESKAPFSESVFLGFCEDASDIIAVSCMANLLPFTLMVTKALKERYPDKSIILAGVGSKSVEDKILKRFPWIDIICRGEGEKTSVALLRALKGERDLREVKGISYRSGDKVIHNPEQARIENIDDIGFPAFQKVDLDIYEGYGIMSSRGCPYPCTFCSVAPVWNLESKSRSVANIIEEMRVLNEKAGVDLFLFQDEFFISGKRHVMNFCDGLRRSGLSVEWKSFGRINLVDEEMMRTMADSGCLELRFGIESGSDRILRKIKKGFTAEETLELIPKAIKIFPRVDAFYVWGFPFETMDDFNQTLFQMISFRMMGARILPSLLSLLPQTEIYREDINPAKLEFCEYLLPEFVLTGQEICHGSSVEIPESAREYFDFIKTHPDIFPGFFHMNLRENVIPKMKLLRKFGFYPQTEEAAYTDGVESCGACSPYVNATGPS